MLFIFDWDGTLCDSTGKITQALHAAMDEFNYPKLPDTVVQSIIGLGLPEAIKVLIPSIEEADVKAVCARYVHHYEEVDRQSPPLFPGAMETLESLLEQEHLIAIATGKTRRGLNKMLSDLKLEGLFHSSRCADETISKPHPLMLHELLGELNISADQALMIGDTSYDLEMAQRAGVRSVAANYGAHSLDKLVPFKPIATLSDIKELLLVEAE